MHPLALLAAVALLSACHARVPVRPAHHLPLDTLVVAPTGAWLSVAAPADTLWRWNRPDAEWPEYAWEVSWQPWDTVRASPPRRESFGWFLERRRDAGERTGTLRALLRSGYVATTAFHTCGSYNCQQIDRRAPVGVRLDAGRVVFALGPTPMLRALLDARPERVQVGFHGRPGGAGERDVPVRYEAPEPASAATSSLTPHDTFEPGPFAAYRDSLVHRLGLRPLAEVRMRSGETEARLWDYGPWGGMTLVRLRAAGRVVRAEAIVFVDHRGGEVSEARTRRHWADVERRFGCRLERPTAARIGTCRASVTRQAAEALRDGLARYGPEALQRVEPPGGTDGGWLIVERRRGAELATYAYWAPFRALRDSVDTPAKVLHPLFQQAVTSRRRER